MEKIIGCCSAIMAIVNIVLSTIWLIIMLKGKKGVKSKFVLPAVLCGIYIVECIMHIICQNTIGIFGMSINVFLWFFNFLIYFSFHLHQVMILLNSMVTGPILNSNSVKNGIASATAIRTMIQNKKNIHRVIPFETYELI